MTTNEILKVKDLLNRANCIGRECKNCPYYDTNECINKADTHFLRKYVYELKDEINRKNTEIDYLRKEYIPMLEKNLRETDKLAMEYMTESAKLQAVIERLNANYEKLLTAKEQIEAEASQEVQSLHREIKAQSNALLAYKEEFERYQSGAYIKLAKAEAYREFAERLNDYVFEAEASDDPQLKVRLLFADDIEKAKKEMVGDTI